MENYKVIADTDFPSTAKEGQLFLLLDTGATYQYHSGEWIHVADAVCDF